MDSSEGRRVDARIAAAHVGAEGNEVAGHAIRRERVTQDARGPVLVGTGEIVGEGPHACPR